jgi:hypothetical protein
MFVLNLLNLVLFKIDDTSSFYLEVPSHVFDNSAVRPIEYLGYLGWCVLGGKGVVSDQTGDLKRTFVDEGHVYNYNVEVPKRCPTFSF